MLGDDFMSRSIEKYFIRAEIPGYMVTHADVTAHYNNKFTSINPNMLSRLRNTLVKAMNEDPLLPKFIVIVVDDDLNKLIDVEDDETDFSESITKMINYVMIKHNRELMSHKENLPKKSKKIGYPQLIWIAPPLHVNFPNNALRAKFNKILETTARNHDNVHCLHLGKGWDDEERNLY